MDCFADPISVQYGYEADDVCIERTDCVCTDPAIPFTQILAADRFDRAFEAFLATRETMTFPVLATEEPSIWI